MSRFRYLILGGTGTLGQEITRQLLALNDREVKSITVFSRDELKQKEMASKFKSYKLHFVLGDIRDLDAVRSAMRNQDLCFHVAALKHIDILEKNPMESVRTNILGTMNVMTAVRESRIMKLAFSSTDKAVDPINVYGMCKSISETILLNDNANNPVDPLFSVFRWGNVVGSRGSVIGTFADDIKYDRKVKITHTEMTRFWISIEDAVRFLLDNYLTCDSNEVQIPPMKSARVLNVARAVATYLGRDDGFQYEIIGKRPGEKMHEVLRAGGESSYSCGKYSDKELIDLVRRSLDG